MAFCLVPDMIFPALTDVTAEALRSRGITFVTFCKSYGLDCVTHAKKPFQKGISECLARFHLRPETAALVGDQIYTDVLGANCAQLTSILISAINNHTIWLKLRHIAELPFIAWGKRRIRHEKH